MNEKKSKKHNDDKKKELSSFFFVKPCIEVATLNVKAYAFTNSTDTFNLIFLIKKP